MFQIEGPNRVVVHVRRTGRLMRPSDHTINGTGLGEVDGVLDVLKNFGSGIVKYASAGLYDPSKNRFYVPFSSGQMRNWAQGFVNTATFGLVKTDKFFGSQTMRTIGTVAGGVAAAGAAYAVGSAASSYFGGGGTPAVSSTSNVVGTAEKVATVAKPTESLFTFSNVAKALDLGTKVIGAAGGVLKPGPPPPGQGGMPMAIPVPVPVSYNDPNMYPPMLMPPGGQPVYGYDPYMIGGGGGVPMVVSGGGGGGGFGPPGSEVLTPMDPSQIDPNAVQQGSSMPTIAVVGIGAAVVYFLFIHK